MYKSSETRLKVHEKLFLKQNVPSNLILIPYMVIPVNGGPAMVVPGTAVAPVIGPAAVGPAPGSAPAVAPVGD